MASSSKRNTTAVSKPEFEQTHVRIQKYNPARRRIVFLLSVLGLLGICWGFYNLGFKTSGYDHKIANEEIRLLQAQVAQLEDQRAQLLRNLALFQRSTEIESQASKEVKQTLNTLETRVMELNEELTFYKSIVSPSEMRRRLSIQNFQLVRAEDKNKFSYKLMLTQVQGNNQIAKGSVKFKLAGKSNGKRMTLSLVDLSDRKRETITFAFKYFQSLEGNLTLPAGFTPFNLEIQINPRSKKLAAIQKSYSWREALAGGV